VGGSDEEKTGEGGAINIVSSVREDWKIRNRYLPKKTLLCQLLVALECF